MEISLPNGAKVSLDADVDAIWEELRAALRERLGREASPSAGVIDSQSLKSAEKGDARKMKQTQWVMTPARVCPEGAYHLWRKFHPESCRLVWKLTSGSVG